jgi:hypothetical protein
MGWIVRTLSTSLYRQDRTPIPNDIRYYNGTTTYEIQPQPQEEDDEA